MKRLLVIPHIKILNANALSSPYTIGFPAMTAWLGAVHALERHLKVAHAFEQLSFSSVAVICHEFDLQTYKGRGQYVNSFVATGNPLDKSGNRAAFIEEARCHLTVSLIIECNNLDPDDEKLMRDTVYLLLNSKIKLAAGDVLKFDPPFVKVVNEQKELTQLIKSIKPGYCLIDRSELMIKTMQTGENAIDALLSYLAVTHRADEKNHSNNKEIKWRQSRKQSGWLVPIAIGFQGISNLASAQNQRDPNVAHRFAESVVTLGEFIMLYGVQDIDNILWHYQTDLDNHLYLCKQNKPFYH